MPSGYISHSIVSYSALLTAYLEMPLVVFRFCGGFYLGFLWFGFGVVLVLVWGCFDSSEIFYGSK